MQQTVGSTSLFEILSIMIAFVSIILLLSLIVTSLVQFVQHALGIRPKYLSRELESFLAKMQDDKKNKLSNKIDKTGILKDAVGFQTVEDKIKDKIKDKTCSWTVKNLWHRPLAAIEHKGIDAIDQETLFNTVCNLKEGTPAYKTAKDYFERQYGHFQDRAKAYIKQEIRLVAFIIAFGVALVFQVDGFELLRELSIDITRREQIVAYADTLISEAGNHLEMEVDYVAFSDKALEELQRRHPDLSETLEEASGFGNSKTSIVNEVKLILEDVPGDHQAIIDEYEEILSSYHQQEAKEALGRAKAYTDQLALFDIVPFKNGFGYYFSFMHLVGILFTTILLSLGAPFWFETLGRLIQFKKILKPKKANDSAA